MMRYFYSLFLMMAMVLPSTVKADDSDDSNASDDSNVPVTRIILSATDKKKETATTEIKTVVKTDKTEKETITTSRKRESASYSSLYHDHALTGTPLNSPLLGHRLVAYPSPTATAPRTSVTNPNVSRPNVPGVSSSYRNDDEGWSAHTNDRLARVTAYWSSEGDYYTGRGLSSTGVRLHEGHCAVDPNIIPYGSIVEIPGLGRYLAVDTGTAVINRTAAREGGHTSAERGAIVVDVFFESASDGERFESSAAKFATITWWTPSTASTLARARSLFADENWTKIQSKQL